MGKQWKQWKQWQTVFLGSTITADGDHSHGIKRTLLLGSKALTNLDSLLKSRDITLLTDFCILKAMVFPVVMYRCESWTIKKAEPPKIDAFELWCWRNSQESLGLQEIKPINPKGNQPWIFIGMTDTEAEAPIFRLCDVKSQLIGKYFDAWKDWRQKTKRQQRIQFLDSITDSMDMNLSKLWDSHSVVSNSVTHGP